MLAGMREGSEPLRALPCALALLWVACGDDAAMQGGAGDAARHLRFEGIGAAMDAGPPDSGLIDPCPGDGGLTDCSSLDGPCLVGVCDVDAGACVTVELEDGLPCDDGDGCTLHDTCVSGECSGSELDCAMYERPCAMAACDAETGTCVTTPLEDGTACDDESECSTASSCSDGLCLATAYVDCSSLDDTCNEGTCDAQLGCVAMPQVGHACDDGDPCSLADACDATGSCAGIPLDCAALSTVCRVASCDAASSTCVFSNVVNGTACDDGSACTEGDECADGECVGTTVSCPSGTTCQEGGCDPATGCTLANRPDGSQCDDGDLCTHSDQCTTGSCAGTTTDCSNLDDACNTGSCDPATGNCEATARANGVSCDTDDLDCTVDTCQNGVCEGANVAECSGCGGDGSGRMCREGVCDTPLLTELEDFESGTLPLEYSTSGDAAWDSTGLDAHSGQASLASPPLSNGQGATLTREVFAGGLLRVEFAFRVSTEAPGDALVYRLDGVELKRWSGVQPWGVYYHMITDAGVHVLSWTYQKDDFGAAGDDRVYLDDVQLTGVVAGREDFEGAAYAASITTGGAGTFSVTNTTAASGSQSFQGPSLGDGQTAWVRYSVTTARSARIGFALRADISDPGDTVTVLYDNVQTFLFDTTSSWTYTGTSVPAGSHTVEWRFDKLGANGTPSTVWIDDISLHPELCD